MKPPWLSGPTSRASASSWPAIDQNSRNARLAIAPMAQIQAVPKWGASIACNEARARLEPSAGSARWRPVVLGSPGVIGASGVAAPTNVRRFLRLWFPRPSMPVHFFSQSCRLRPPLNATIWDINTSLGSDMYEYSKASSSNGRRPADFVTVAGAASEGTPTFPDNDIQDRPMTVPNRVRSYAWQSIGCPAGLDRSERSGGREGFSRISIAAGRILGWPRASVPPPPMNERLTGPEKGVYASYARPEFLLTG